MASLTYYTFSKRSKSTAQPTGGTLIDINLKDGTSLISPVFLLNYSGRPGFNYVNFEGRYYFVSDIKRKSLMLMPDNIVQNVPSLEEQN